MAIRIGLPPPMLPRVRSHWHSACVQAQRQTRLLRAWAASTGESVRAWWQNAASQKSLRARALQRQCGHLDAFEQRYEDLIGLLCGAARDGMTPQTAGRYNELRRWMVANYRSVRQSLRPYWYSEETRCDPFEALFASDNVEEVIHAATGIEDIILTRTALASYRETLTAKVAKS